MLAPHRPNLPRYESIRHTEPMLTVETPQSTSKRMLGHLNGILNIYKPSGWTSHDVVLRLRRLMGLRKIGHAGTLDPSATGVLPVLLGKGTKIAEHLVGWEKEYVAVLRLGQSTDTQDATGTVLSEASTDGVSEEQIRSAVKEFQGDIQQIPPMYSAVKVNGQPLYKAARRGETVQRSPRIVTIYRIEVLTIRGRDIDLRVMCSKGTYIRTLCADIGERLQVGGHLLCLERSRVGPLHVKDSLDLEDVTNESVFSGMNRAFLTIDRALEQFPFVTVKSDYVTKVMNGAPIPWEAFEAPQGGTRVYHEHECSRIRIRNPQGQLLALGIIGPINTLPRGGNTTVCIENVLIEK